MILLEMDTEHHEFLAMGETEEEARRALKKALEFHGEAHSLAPRWWVGHYDINLISISAGECLRDRQLLYRKGQTK